VSHTIEIYGICDRCSKAKTGNRRSRPWRAPALAAEALGNVYAEPVRGSLIIAITAQHRDPEAAALVANRSTGNSSTT